MKGAKLYQLSHYTTGVILKGKRNEIAWQGMGKVDFENYDGIITFVNINRSHWRFVFLHAQCHTIFVLDPLRGRSEQKYAKEACRKFGQFFKMLRNDDERHDWGDTDWKPGKITHSFQEDDFSCGVFVMLMAKQVVEEFPKIPTSINVTPSKEMMCHYRKILAKDILLASVSREEYCSVCGKTEKDQTEEQSIWVQCELCKRWSHVKCLNINVPPKKQAWICDLCL